MIWLILYFVSLVVFPPAFFVVILFHILATLENGRSKKREKEMENAIKKALSK